MMEKFDRAFYLHQIPVFALRKQLLDFLHDGDAKKLMVSRMKQVLKRKTIRDPAKTIKNLTRESLVQIIKKYPEINDARIIDLFEEYRYGTNPSFFIYLFNPNRILRQKIEKIQPVLMKCIEVYNQTIPKELPRVQKLVSDDLFMIKDGIGVIEGTYHFQKRLDLIDKDENPASIYETVYGFFWINIEQGYVVIQARDRSILHALENAITEGAGVHMVSLMITKELKNALPFLLNEAICSSKLHDPNPKSRRFHWVSITDDHLYNKGYKNWEKKYPEVSSARYKIEIAGMKDRTLNIGFDYGEMSIAGKLTASQFRDWALTSLSEIIGKIRDFEKEPSKYIKTRKFIAVKELIKYQTAQKEQITKLLAILLELKSNRDNGSRMIEVSPLELARDLKDLVYVQFRVTCQEDNCLKDGYLTCPNCGSKFFRVSEESGKWTLTCTSEKRNSWSSSLPLDTKCEQEHPMTISAKDLEVWIEILPGKELLEVISDIIKKYIPGFLFNSDIEYFMIHGWNMIYYLDSGDLSSLEPGTEITIYNIQTGDVIDSNITAGQGNQSIVIKAGLPPPEKKNKAKQKEQLPLPMPS